MTDGDVDLEALEGDLLTVLLHGVDECKSLKYNPTAFLMMLHERGAVGALRQLLLPPVERCSDGFTRLWEMKRLDLAAEYPVAFNERFAPLFTPDERRIARERLALFGEHAP